jgi:hypothetical protein
MSSEIKDGISRATPPVADPVVPPPPPTPWWPVLLTGLLAVVPAAILGFLYWQSQQSQAALAHDLAEAKAQAAAAEATARAAAASLTAPEAAGLNNPGAPQQGLPGGPDAVEYVPYGETPLANARLERLRTLAAAVEGQSFRGRIVVESFIGDFCLSGNVAEGFVVAETGLPTQECDLVGNPFEDGLSPAQRESVAFANFAASLAQRTAGAITVATVTAGRRNPVEYPEQREGSTAGEWNAVAAQNNRVEFHVIPAE